MTLVSVVIPTYNRAALVQEAIESVLNQTYQHCELIVVDDGSTDETAEVFTSYGSRITAIRINHAGPSAARNCGIRIGRGDYIAFLDSDDLWLPKKLQTQINFFEHNPEAQICQSEEIWIRNGKRVNPRNKHKKNSGWIFEQCLPLCVVSPSAVMIHRSVFDAVGLFDETFLACEDYDLWLRIAPRYPIYLIDEPLIIKRGGHADQQSRAIPSLDQYRIRALCKILDSGILTPLQYQSALQQLITKCRIYGNGCLKRGKQEEGEMMLKIPHRYSNESPAP
jgi:glycosyltransferase involved in cell wall biosynthesis